MKDYTKLKTLLEEQETFPLDFTFKCVGHNSVAFKQSAAQLPAKFPGLVETLARESSSGKHLALTFAFKAPSADAIAAVFQAIERLEGVLVIL
jgi:putative lipoic acid-binding regulatory protein